MDKKDDLVKEQSKAAPERERERRLKAYDIANQISEFSESYWEAMTLINYMKENFEWAKTRGKAELLPYPVDRWGNKIKLLGAEAPSPNRE
ncbi:MAG: hypothetical protein K2K46_01450 [Lachnospiraceae bacterium]|nr:hypothetical protein [Lachnospiraceae bacterium]